MEARAGLSNFRAKLLERASVLTDRLAAQPLYKAVLAVAVASAMLLLVTAINDGIKGHATRVLIADSELAAHATLKIYVADVPDEYRMYQPAEEFWAFRSLGNIIDLFANQWDSMWHAVDRWFTNQMHISPLRIYSADEADIVYINAALTMFPDKAESVPLKFARNAAYLLPLLGRKPHVLVLNHPADTWNIYHPGFLDHPSTQLMTLISINAMSRGLNLSNLVGSPQFGFHWHQGSPELQEPFNETKLQHEKMQLLTGTFGLRGNGDTATDPLRPQRLYLMEQCLAAGPNCSFVEWKYDGDGGDNHQAINRATRESWYNLQPTGDFVTRISFFQTILVDALNIVLEPDYLEHLPFRDHIAYDRMVLYIPGYSGTEQHHYHGTGLLQAVLAQASPERALEGLRYSHSVRQLFQYSLNPKHELITFAAMNKVHKLDDAFTFTIKSVLRHLCRQAQLPAHKCSAATSLAQTTASA